MRNRPSAREAIRRPTLIADSLPTTLQRRDQKAAPPAISSRQAIPRSIRVFLLRVKLESGREESDKRGTREHRTLGASRAPPRHFASPPPKLPASEPPSAPAPPPVPPSVPSFFPSSVKTREEKKRDGRGKKRGKETRAPHNRRPARRHQLRVRPNDLNQEGRHVRAPRRNKSRDVALTQLTERFHSRGSANDLSDSAQRQNGARPQRDDTPQREAIRTCDRPLTSGP